MCDAYTIAPARYSKGDFAIRCPSDTGLKTRAARLIGDGLNCRHSGREKAYIASASKVKKFEKLYAAGWDACVITGKLEAPRESENA
jgi:hypothetical protein